MALFQEFEFEHEKDIKLITLTCDIACEKAMIDFNMADISLQTYMEDGDEPQSNGKFIETIHRIFKAILTALQDFAHTMRTIGHDHISFDDYMGSDAGKINVSYDMEKVHKIINDEMSEGSALIRKLSKLTGKPPMEVSRYITSDHSFERAKLEDAVSAAKVLHWYNAYANDRAIKSLERYVKEADEIAEYTKNPLAQKKIVKVAITMKSMITDYIKVASVVSSQIRRNAMYRDKKDTANKNK